MNNSNTYSLVWGFRLPLLQKVALSGLFIALACILNKILAINYIAAVPFVRVSFGGPAIIMFAGFLLGPLFGGLVGGLQDILGYLVFDIKAFPYSPTITTTYFLLGACSGFIFYLLSKVNSKNISRILTYSVMSITFIGISLYLILNDTATWGGVTHNIETWMKIVYPLLMLALFAILVTFTEIAAKKDKFKDLKVNVFQLVLGCFILEVLIMTLYGSLMKAVLFGMDKFLVILFCQSMTMFFNIPFNVIVLSFIMKSTRKYYIK